jgi:hypothetical protein
MRLLIIAIIFVDGKIILKFILKYQDRKWWMDELI